MIFNLLILISAAFDPALSFYYEIHHVTFRLDLTLFNPLQSNWPFNLRCINETLTIKLCALL